MDPFSIAAAIFTITVAGSLVGLHASKPKVPRFARWASPPRVYVSTNAPVTVDQVLSACEWLTENTGIKFGTVQSTPITDYSKISDGSIFICMDSDLDMDRAAEATATYEPKGPGDQAQDQDVDHESSAEDIAEHVDGVMKRAIIKIEPPNVAWDMDLLLRHELVHADGCKHVETAMVGRRKKDKKNGKRKAGDVRRIFGISLIGRKTGHLMNPKLSLCGEDITGIKP